MNQKSQAVGKKKTAEPALSFAVPPNWKFAFIAGLILILIIGAVWSAPRATGDLWIALAGGRDIASGQFNIPDTWSFTTHGRPWLNQNWGSDLIFFLIYQAFGNLGLLGFKLLLIAFIGLFLVLLMLKRQVPHGIALLVTAELMITLNSYLNLRPNLLTMTLTPLVLLLLFATRERPARIWFLVPLMFFWANIHGGFILGLGMMLLWTFSTVSSKVLTEGLKGLKPNWHFLAGTGAAILVTAFVNPFGPFYLLFPFKMVNGGLWNTVIDWKPVWVAGSSFAGVRDFFIIISISCLLMLINSLIYRARAISNRRPASELIRWGGDSGRWIFDLLFTGITLAMAVSSIRFIPIALLCLAPIIASQVWRLLSFTRREWILAPIVLLVLMGGGSMVRDNVRSYAPDNPFSPTGTGTFFEKMHCLHSTYPVDLAGFIKDNHLEGPVLNSWEWEGFLRWHCPQMKIFIGGRAQQVYDEETFKEYMALYYGDGNIFPEKSFGAILKSTKARFIAVPNTDDFESIIKTAINSGNWAIVYADRQSLLLVDLDWAVTRKIGEASRDRSLRFKNPATEFMSQAAYCLSQPRDFPDSEAITKFAAAFEL